MERQASVSQPEIDRSGRAAPRRRADGKASTRPRARRYVSGGNGQQIDRRAGCRPGTLFPTVFVAPATATNNNQQR